MLYVSLDITEMFRKCLNLGKLRARCVLVSYKTSPDGVVQGSLLGQKHAICKLNQLVKLLNGITLYIIVIPMILMST